MKRTTIIGTALAMGMLAVGAVSVSAADAQAAGESSSSIANVIKAKELELREQYAYDRIDANKVAQLEDVISELRTKANLPAAKTQLTTPAAAVYEVTTP